MYYRPNTDLKRDKAKSEAAGKDVFVGNNTQHVGFVEDPDLKPGFIQTIDGNAGGSNANWSLGMGGGVVSENTTPLAGITGINRFLQVVTEVEIEGRWKVVIGVYTWHYIFLDGGKALCTDIANLTNARYVGTWSNQGTFIEIKWPKTGEVERWKIPLARADHPGTTVSGSYSTSATKIQTKKRVGQTTFTENVDP
jgi:hypothetical protein